MYSLSKTPIALDAAQAIVRACFGGSAQIAAFSELTDGYFNAAYRLDMAGGGSYVLKVAPSPSVPVLRYEQGMMGAEVAALRLVRQGTTVPVPTVVCYDSSARIIANEYFIMTFVPGVPLDKLRAGLAQADKDAIQRELGSYLRQMNEIAGQRFGYLAQPAAPGAGWRATFAQMVEGVLADGEDMRVALPYADLRARLTASYGVLDTVTTPRLVHWDLWDGNIFVDPATQRITGIIDFERALWGDPLIECNWGAFGAPSEAFMAGYGRTQPFSAGERRRRMLYNIYLYLIMVIECSYRRYETDKQEKWARGKLDQELAMLEV